MLALYIGLVIYAVTLSAVCAFAFLCGGKLERRVVGALIIAVLATMIAALSGGHWRGPQWGVMIVDLCFLLVLVVIARHSTRFWPLWTAASQLGGCLAHLPAILFPSMPKELYAATQPFWVFPLMGSLAWGTLLHLREAKRDRVTSSDVSRCDRRRLEGA